MRIGEVARGAGVNVQTLRYYERRGLLEAPERTRAGYRQYGRNAVQVVRFIKQAQELGFTLRDVEELLGLTSGDRTCRTVQHIATRKLAELEQKIAALQAMKGSLERLLTTCNLPGKRRDCPLLEALA